MKAILLNDWKNLLRNKQLLVAIALFFAVGLYAIYYGNAEVQKQEKTITSVIEKEQKDIKTAIEKFKEPNFDVSWSIRRTIANYPNKLAALSLGQKDVFPYTKTVRAYGFYGSVFGSEIANPYKLLTGNFDLAFVFIFLLPLLLIALSYNLLSAEKENGTLSLILVNYISLKKLIFTKILFRFLLVLGFVILLFLIGLIAINAPMNSSTFSWFWAVIFYTVFWCCLIFYWVSWQQNSAFNALVLLGNWLFFVVLIPTFLNLYLQSTKPISSGANLQRELREITEKGWGVPKKENLVKFFAEKGEIDTTKINADMVNEIGLIYYMDKTAKPHFDEYKTQLVSQINASNTWSWLSPAMQTQTTLHQIAESDTDNYLRFLENTEKYYYQIRDFCDTQKLANKKFEKNDFEKIPKAEISSNKVFTDVMGYVKIIAFGLVFLLLGLVKINKK
jgi:ABC-2 type transport system permease protein